MARQKSPARVLNDIAIDIVHMRVLSSNPAKLKLRPGEAYDRLPQETKDVLKRLTSADACNVRKDLIPVFAECQVIPT